jgi:histidinol-phosphate/aromatic aminotransferase/cobyric acid decarboxylase-like protein
MGPEPRPELLTLAPAVHGGSLDPAVLDFSTGISPLPPPPGLFDAVRNADLSRYPHPSALPVREALSALHDAPPEHVVVGSGSVELIWAVARAFAGPGRSGLVVTPAFAEYAQALRASGASVLEVSMPAPRFTFPVDAVAAALAAGPLAVVFICRPSNPCLSWAAPDEIAALARRWPETLFVIDEAYLPMFDGVAGIAPGANIAVLRSLTKVFALAGLRVGYLLATSPIAAAVQATLPPWNVSSAAQAAGVVAARLLPTHGPAIRAQIGSLRTSLRDQLAGVLAAPVGAGGPFLLYELDDAPELARALLAGGIAVRHAASFGLPRHLRIGVRDAGANSTLVARCRELRLATAQRRSAP